MTKDACGVANDGPTILKTEPTGKAFEPHACDCDLGECRTNVLPFMNEMSRIAHGAEDLSETLGVLLETLKTHMNVVRAMVSLFEPGSGNIFIHTALVSARKNRRRASIFWERASPGGLSKLASRSSSPASAMSRPFWIARKAAPRRTVA